MSNLLYVNKNSKTINQPMYVLYKLILTQHQKKNEKHGEVLMLQFKKNISRYARKYD